MFHGVHRARQKFLSTTIAIVAVTLPTHCLAADDGPTFPDVVLSDATIPYRDADAGSAEEWKDCDWNRSMTERLVEQSEGRVHAAGTTTAPQRTLALVTQTMHIVGGGGFSGPKWLVIEGTLTEGGRTIGSFEARRQSLRGSLRACSTVRDLAEDIADDIVEWLASPKLASKLGDAK